MQRAKCPRLSSGEGKTVPGKGGKEEREMAADPALTEPQSYLKCGEGSGSTARWVVHTNEGEIST